MPRKNLEEKDRCRGTRPSGTRCVHRAVFGDPPKWCSKCDPSAEAIQRRRDAGRKRHPEGSPEAIKRDETRVEGTLDDIVRNAVETSKELARAARLAAPKDSLAAARMAQAAAALHRAAISALRSRGHVGDVPHGAQRQHSPNPLHPADGAPAVPVQTPDPLAALNEGLNREGLDS